MYDTTASPQYRPYRAAAAPRRAAPAAGGETLRIRSLIGQAFSQVFANFGALLLGFVVIAATYASLAIPVFVIDAANVGEGSRAHEYAVNWMHNALALPAYMAACLFADMTIWNARMGQRAMLGTRLWRSLRLAFPVLVPLFVVAIVPFVFGRLFAALPALLLFLTVFGVFGPATLHEPQTSYFQSFGRSRALTSGFRVRAFFAHLSMGLVLSLVFIVIVLIAGAALAHLGIDVDNVDAMTFGKSDGTLQQSLGVTLVANTVMSTTLYVLLGLYSSFTVALYIRLRELHEGAEARSLSQVFG